MVRKHILAAATAAAAWIAPGLAQAACPVHDAANYAVQGKILEHMREELATVRQILTIETNIYNAHGARGGDRLRRVLEKANVDLTALLTVQQLAGAAPDLANVTAIAGDGLAKELPDFSDYNSTRQWIRNALAADNATAQAVRKAVAARRHQALTEAALAGYAMGLNARQAAAEGHERTQALVDIGDAAEELREQLGGLHAALLAVYDQLATSNALRSAQLEIRAAETLRSSVTVERDVHYEPRVPEVLQ